jgi:hypothetical protein
LLARFFEAAMPQGGRQRAVCAAGQANKAVGMFFQFVFLNRTFTFLRAQLHFGNQATEVLIARPGRNEQRKTEFTTEAGRHGEILEWLMVDGCLLIVRKS